MTRRQKDLVRLAELSALGPPDAVVLLAEVAGAIRGMVREGRLHDADAVLASMNASTARVVAMALAGDLDRIPQEDSGELADLLARIEREYVTALAREDSRLDLARVEAEKISTGRNSRFIDQAFIRKMHEVRRRRMGGEG